MVAIFFHLLDNPSAKLHEYKEPWSTMLQANCVLIMNIFCIKEK